MDILDLVGMFQVKDNLTDCKVWIFDYSNYLFIICF